MSLCIQIVESLSDDGNHIFRKWIEKKSDGGEEILRVDVLPNLKRKEGIRI